MLNDPASSPPTMLYVRVVPASASVAVTVTTAVVFSSTLTEAWLEKTGPLSFRSVTVTAMS